MPRFIIKLFTKNKKREVTMNLAKTTTIKIKTVPATAVPINPNNDAEITPNKLNKTMQ